MFLQCLVVIFLIILIVDRWKPKEYVKLHQQLGNDWNYFPIVGNALQFIGSNEDRMAMLSQLHLQASKRKHKAVSVWLANIFFIGKFLLLAVWSTGFLISNFSGTIRNVIADADSACAVLKSAFDKKFVRNGTKYLIGDGSIFAPVEIWHRRRKILTPTFAPKHVDKFITVFEAQSKIAAKQLESRVGKGNFSCYDYFSACSLDSVCETLFGVNVDIQRQPEHPFINAFKESMKDILVRISQPWLHIEPLFKLLPLYKKQEHTKKIIHEFVDNLIYTKKSLMDKRDENIERSNNSTNKLKPDIKSFLELMIENSKDTDKACTEEELREEVIVLALAGTDTAAVVNSFTILLLSQHPDIQEKVYREIQDVLGDSDRPLQLEDLSKLKFTKAVIKETLRLYPAAPFITRHCKQDLALPSGLVLPKGCNVLVSIWGIQRNPEHWGEDANDFNPDRFMSGKIPTPNAFIAFSHGPRNCIGQQYAMLSMTTTLVTILRRYRFIPATNFTNDKKNQFRLSFDLTLKDVGNFTVQVEYRDKLKQNNKM